MEKQNKDHCILNVHCNNYLFPSLKKCMYNKKQSRKQWAFSWDNIFVINAFKQLLCLLSFYGKAKFNSGLPVDDYLRQLISSAVQYVLVLQHQATFLS